MDLRTINLRPNPINKSPEKNLTLRWNRPFREAKIGHGTDLIGQFQHSVKLNGGILFVGLGPGSGVDHNYILSLLVKSFTL